MNDIVPGCMLFNKYDHFPYINRGLVIAVRKRRSNLSGRPRIYISLFLDGKVKSIWLLPGDIKNLDILPPEVGRR